MPTPLIISRRPGQTLCIGDDIRITPFKIVGSAVMLEVTHNGVTTHPVLGVDLGEVRFPGGILVVVKDIRPGLGIVRIGTIAPLSVGVFRLETLQRVHADESDANEREFARQTGETIEGILEAQHV